MNANEKIAKLRRWAAIAGKILLAVQALMVVWTVAVGLVVVCNFMDFTDISVRVGFVYSESSGNIPLTLLALLLAALLLAISFDILQTARSMMRDIADHETPFEQIQVRRMRRIALLIVIYSLLQLRIDSGVLLAALVLWGFSMVFDYGCLLQQESDETL